MTLHSYQTKGNEQMIFDREHECMSREDLGKLQGERLTALVKRVYDRVPFYSDLFDKSGVAPEQVRGLDDLRRLPFTRKYNLRDEYPFGLFATPLKDVVRIHASSGTTGKPTTVGYTRNDIAMWAKVCARALAGAGTTDDDIVQVAYGYGLFTGGLGAHYGGGAASAPRSSPSRAATPSASSCSCRTSAPPSSAARPASRSTSGTWPSSWSSTSPSSP